MVTESQAATANRPIDVSDQEGGLNLGRFVAAIRRNLVIMAGVTALTATAAGLKTITDPPEYRSGFELLTPATTLETEVISTLNPDALSNQTDVVGVAIDQTQLKILTSPRLMEPVVETIRERYPNLTYRQVVNNLSIASIDEDGSVLRVTYTDEDPELVLDVLEVVADAYLTYSREDRQDNILQGIEFVDEQLPAVRDRVEALEGSLESLRQNSNLINPVLEGEQLAAQTAQFTGELLNLRVQIQQAQELSRTLQEELAEGEEFAVTSTLLSNPRYQAILNELLEVDKLLAQELTLYLEGSPEIAVIQETRDNLQLLLTREGVRAQEEIENSIRELGDRDRALSTTIDVLNQQIKNLSSTARAYNKIQRELEIATVNLNQFLTKREALRIDAAQRQTPWEILTPATLPQNVAASAVRNVVLGSILGLLLGAGTAILIDRMRGTIHTSEELKEATRLPILGNIPYEKLLEDPRSLALVMRQMRFSADVAHNGTNGNRVQPAYPSLPFFEAFKVLATNLQAISPDSPIKMLTVSAATPNMGKSTISFHLAHAVAATGKRVLLVDTDLRRPTLHDLCGIANDKGLSNYATGQFKFKDVCVSLATESTLYVLPSGPIPPDPVRIFSAQRVQNLFNNVSRKFDLVIFDTPPFLGFADASVVAAKTQGLLLVATLGNVKTARLQSALDDLYTAKIPILGVVANGAEQPNKEIYRNYYPPSELSMMNGTPATDNGLDGMTAQDDTTASLQPMDKASSN